MRTLKRDEIPGGNGEILVRLLGDCADGPLGPGDGVCPVEDAKDNVIAPALVVFEPDHLPPLAGGEIAQYVMRRRLDPQRVMAGLQILPFIEARQLVLAGRDLEAEPDAIID